MKLARAALAKCERERAGSSSVIVQLMEDLSREMAARAEANRALGDARDKLDVARLDLAALDAALQVNVIKS